MLIICGCHGNTEVFLKATICPYTTHSAVEDAPLTLLEFPAENWFDLDTDATYSVIQRTGPVGFHILIQACMNQIRPTQGIFVVSVKTTTHLILAQRFLTLRSEHAHVTKSSTSHWTVSYLLHSHFLLKCNFRNESMFLFILSSSFTPRGAAECNFSAFSNQSMGSDGATSRVITVLQDLALL